MNKKYLWNVLTIMTALFTCISLSSCGDDGSNETGSDSGGNGNNNFAELIIGSWKQNYSDGYEMYTFRRNGSLSYVEYDNKEGEYVQNGTYSFDTNKMRLTMKAESGKSDVLQVIRLTANELELKELGVYVRVDGASKEDDPADNPNEDNPTDNPQENTSTGVRGPVADSFKGAGTQAEPYLISNASELRKLADDVNSGKTYEDKHFSLVSDIIINKNVLKSDGTLNASAVSQFELWHPIGGQGSLYNRFKGYFEGNNHTISGIYVNQETTDVGLFGHFDGKLYDLTLKDSYIRGTGSVGGIAGVAPGAYFYNIKNYAFVEGDDNSDYIGGIAGDKVSGTKFRMCVNYGKVSGYSHVAGIVGGSNQGTFCYDCANYGEIRGNLYVAGIISRVYGNKFQGGSTGAYNCLNKGIVKSENYGAGIACSSQYYGRILNCVNIGEVHVENMYAGIIEYVEETLVKNSFYLNTTALTAINRTSGSNTLSNNASMTSTEMKEQSFLDELNKNAKALGSSYSLWKFGKDGFPTLEWIEE